MRVRIHTAIGVLLLGMGAAPAMARADAPIYQFNLPEQSLSEALKAVGQQATTNILFDPKSVENRTAHSLHATLTTKQAIDQLLAGTDLVALQTSADTVLVEPRNMPGTASTERPGSVATAASSPAEGEREGKTRSSGPFRMAQADQGAAAGAAAVESNGAPHGGAVQLEEIVVTAQKRSERLIDTPQSVSVLSGEDLNKLGAVQFRDFATTVPGLDFTTTGAGYTQISLRGVTAGFDVGSTVGIYVDDVPYGSSSAFAQGGQVALDVGLFDMDRIEVLRGPQGTLYGASTMGGLIKYVTRSPDTTSFGGLARTGVSTTQDGGISYNAAGAVNTPFLANTAALRASAFYSRDGGYIDNVARAESDINRSGVYGGRLDFLLQPVEGLSIRLTGFLQDISRNGEATADYALSGHPVFGDLKQFRLVSEPFDQHFRLGSATIGYDFGAAKLTSITSYQTTTTDLTYDVSGAYAGFCKQFLGVTCSAVGLPQGLATHKVTQEIRLASGAPGDLEWLLGGFYTHESSDNAQAFSLIDSAGLLSSADLYHELNTSRYEEYAGFLDLTYHITHQFDVSGGVRYSNDRQTFTQNGSGAFGTTTPASGSTENVLTYLANARYHLNDNATGYVRFATGYRPGGPNFTLKDPTTGLPVGPPVFGPDKLKSFEAGIKAETSDRAYSLDLAGYYIDWRDIRFAVAEGKFSGIENAGNAKIGGAELALTGRPVQGLTAQGSFAYQDARLSETVPALGGTDGERLPNVPRFTGALNADYVFTSQKLLPTIGTTVRYVTDRMASFDNSFLNAQYRLPAYTTLDLRGGLTLSSVDLQLYVHNLFDKRGELSSFGAYSATGETKLAILQPRTIGIALTMHF